jgi:2-methylcitrate synthase/citrate synthase II
VAIAKEEKSMSEQAQTYSPGLAGVVAGESAICWVDPNSGLRYRGYDVEELASAASFEQVAWLILHGELPSKAELAEFKRQLVAQRTIPPAVLDILRLLPRQARPMDMLRTGVSALGSFDPDLGKIDHDANMRKSVRLLALLTPLTTSGWQILQGNKPFPGDDQPSLAERFLFGLSGTAPQPWQSKALDTILILYAEHEFNASTFAARVTASTLPDMYSCIVSAIGTLEGPLHGGANEEAMKVLEEIGSAQKAEQWVKERLARKEKIMGFGHRVYKTGDSRVPTMRKLLEAIGKQTGQTQWLPICQKLEEVMEREKGLFANLDLYAAPVLHLLQIPVPLNTPLFACSRVVGWAAHVTEQQDHNRIIRPRSNYTGPGPRKFVPGKS